MDSECVFCDPTKIQNVIGETKDVWIIAAPGQISDGGYLLAVPKRHASCVGAMKQREFGSLASAVEKTHRVLEQEYGPIVIFEHGIAGQTIKHAHLHFIPGKFRLTEKIYEDFPNYDLSIMYCPDKIASLRLLHIVYALKPAPYLFWDENPGFSRIIQNPITVPLQYLRTLSAQALGHPERADWRTMDPELDRQLISETMRRLKPYF